jgi:hypothetical protein
MSMRAHFGLFRVLKGGNAGEMACSHPDCSVDSQECNAQSHPARTIPLYEIPGAHRLVREFS